MQQHGGSPYGEPQPRPEMSPFSTPPPGPRAHPLPIPGAADQLHPSTSPQPLPEAASPISSRPPLPAAHPNYEELAAAAGDDGTAGEEAERGGASGNRWPREETLALLQIRSEMDAAFRDATLKGPLWEDVSRKLEELGYKRSAKKCKEKFENVHKYYKRTKDGRAGRQDGKSYRFFTQLEALHAAAPPTNPAAFPPLPLPISAAAPAAVPAAAPSPVPLAVNSRPPPALIQPIPISAAPPRPPPAELGPPSNVLRQTPGATTPTAVAGAASMISFSTTSESESDEFDDEVTEETGGVGERGVKRKRKGGPGSGSRNMMAFFEGLMKQVMEQQEAMQQQFLETMEKREQERVIREEAWRRQETARLNREQELLAQERAMAASRDSAVISFIQKITGQTIPLPPVAPTPITTVVISPQQFTAPPPSPPPPPQPPQQQKQTKPPPQQQQQQPPPLLPQPQQQPPPPKAQPQQQQQQNDHHEQSAQAAPHPAPVSTALVPVQAEPYDGVTSMGHDQAVPSSRWPKTEIHALIQIRTGLDSRYQEAGPKGPLWEEISARMQRMGYNRSAKRCKEKWENINKYYKKVKESNKKRPEDSKTCPYFDELDALHRKKLLGTAATTAGRVAAPIKQQQEGQENLPHPTPQQIPTQSEAQGNKNANTAMATTPATNYNGSKRNGELTPGQTDETGVKKVGVKPEDVVKELCQKMDDPDSENMDEDTGDDNDDSDEEGGKMQYRIQYQRPNVGGGDSNAPAAATTAPGSSFLTMA